ncbi:DHA1 family bicyclomycin/chloramphenicol resistance-like MFS transporter [Pseudomonas hunanensis]|uniref:DHA1 family bicyclomycin/chloramphenicol resistance-like MFS transporter n=1 Tax=Pseudomonas hunanensis TaxID=1247546 RepID=A0ACC6JZF4_9PSED|nr:Bcr/CflA family multidrug efflux MFS transporter [Pseudomonas hunanensis]MDR6711497.1 DHA1 family bicyclomycin/chloramphenicol resistance-like MFS transporter [Pseudomonas hunanensis]
MPSVDSPQRLIVALAALVAFAPLSIDTYLPSLPLIASDLASRADEVQLTISFFLAGLCVGMLFIGPLSDRYGRHRLLIAGIVLYLLATLGCMFASTIASLITWRFFQALGGAAASVIGRAIVRDLFPLKQSARVLSLMHLVTMVATLVAPLMGSLLADIAGWRAVFAMLFVFAAACLLSVLFQVPESLPSERRGKSLGQAFRAYALMAAQPAALGYMLCMGLTFGGMFAFITESPFVYIKHFGISPHVYAWLFALNIAGVIVLTSLNARFVGRLGPARMLFLGAGLALFAALLLLVIGVGGLAELPALVFGVLLFVSVTGLVGANCVASLLALFPNQAGAAAGLAVAGQFAMGTACSALVGRLSDGTPWAMCVVMGIAGVGCFLALQLARRASLSLQSIA